MKKIGSPRAEKGEEVTMENKQEIQNEDMRSQETGNILLEYQKPDVKTYTSDELEEKIGPALTGSVP